jgi:hypothetical protein
MAVKVTERTNVFRVHLKASAGQILKFEVTASGAIPTFVYQAPNGELVFKSSQVPGHPKTLYERPWPRAADDPPTNGVYLLNFGFAGAISYTLVVTQRDAGGTILRTIKNVDYEREDQHDMYAEPFRLVVS